MEASVPIGSTPERAPRFPPREGALTPYPTKSEKGRVVKRAPFCSMQQKLLLRNRGHILQIVPLEDVTNVLRLISLRDMHGHEIATFLDAILINSRLEFGNAETDQRANHAARARP